MKKPCGRKCCFGENLDSHSRESFIAEKRFRKREVILSKNDIVKLETLRKSTLGLNGKALILIRHDAGVTDGDCDEYHSEFFTFYEGSMSLMYTKILSISKRFEEYAISSDQKFGILVKDSNGGRKIKFSTRSLDHKKYSKVTEGRLTKNVQSIDLKGKIVHQTVHSFSRDNSLFCFIINGFWASRKEKFCDIFIFKCIKRKSSFLLEEFFKINLKDEVQILHEISRCKFNLTGDKLLLIFDETFIILGVKNNLLNPILAKGLVNGIKEFFWTVDLDYGELIIEVDRFHLSVTVYVIDFECKRLETCNTFSLSPLIEDDVVRFGAVSVSSGITRLLLGLAKLTVINPFTGVVEDVFEIDGEIFGRGHMIKDILPNWPGKEVIISLINQGVISFIVYRIKLFSLLSLKSSAAIETLETYSLDNLRKLSLPKSVKEFLNL